MGRLVVSSLDGEWRGVDADLRGGDAALTFDLQRRVQTEGRTGRTGGGVRPGRRQASWCSSVGPRGGNT